MNESTILIIDDEPEILNLLSRVLQMQGFVVRVAHTLSEGIRELVVAEPAVLFLDINLPDGNGLQKLKELRKKFPTVKIIMISALDSTEDRKKALENGAHTFLSKPFNLRQVSSLVHQFKKG